MILNGLRWLCAWTVAVGGLIGIIWAAWQIQIGSLISH